jgi:hypothetical protein
LVADPKANKEVTEKRLIFTSQKISLPALNTALLELDSGLPVKSRKLTEKSIILENLCRTKKSYILK